MRDMLIYALIALLSAAIAGGLVTFYNYRKNKIMLQGLNTMLDAAIANIPQQVSYDETMLSQIEAKLNRYLSTTVLIKDNQGQEKERIKMLISDISHQTKTPIANILLYVQLLEEQVAVGTVPCPAKELIQQIAASSEKLNFLIQALIKTSRMEAGIIHVNPQRHSVNDLIDSIAAQIEESAQSKDIKVHIHEASQAQAQAVFDPKWTEEALYNILDNSIKYTAYQGTVTITVEPYELFTRIKVIDTGMGMTEQEINKIFQRFYRSPQVSQVEGVGIGLYITREIITMQGGYIKVSSEIGKGSTFSVFLPR